MRLIRKNIILHNTYNIKYKLGNMKKILSSYLGSDIGVDSGDEYTSGKLYDVTDNYFVVIDKFGTHYYPFTAILEIRIKEKILIKIMGVGIIDAINDIH